MDQVEEQKFDGDLHSYKEDSDSYYDSEVDEQDEQSFEDGGQRESDCDEGAEELHFS